METPAGHASPTTTDVRRELQRGLGMLLEAYHCAEEFSRDVWDFAVEISGLRAVGLRNHDLRWLVCKGCLEHAHEVTPAEGDGREFRHSGSLTFTRRSCFVLTQAGIRLATQVADEFPSVHEELDYPASPPSSLSEPVPAPAPHWDRDRHEFRLNGQLVKVFKLPSPNQEMILAAFEEEGWPPRIDDPLPMVADLDPKRRLQDTIKSLNRNQKNRLIRFMGDGSGEGIRWTAIAPSSNGKASKNGVEAKHP